MGRESRARAARVAGLTFAVSVNPEKPDQLAPGAAAALLRRLLDARALPHWSRLVGLESPDGLGDCHEVAQALMADLLMAHEAAGWSWVTGTQLDGRDHSWLEFDGWAVDASHWTLSKTGGGVLVMDADLFRAAYRAASVAVLSAAEFEARVRAGDLSSLPGGGSVTSAVGTEGRS